MQPNDRYSGVMPRVLIVLALGFLAGLVLPVTCHSQPVQNIRPASISPDGTTTRDTVPPILSDSARKAQLQTLDSLFAKIDSILAQTKAYPADPVLIQSGVETRWRIRSYAGGILLGLAANEVFRIDGDPCPTGKHLCFSTNYKDRWIATDKAEHFQAAYFLTTSATEFGVPPGWAFGLTCGLAGPGFEVTQRGYISLRDIAADCAGSATALGLKSLLTKMHAEGWFR